MTSTLRRILCLLGAHFDVTVQADSGDTHTFCLWCGR